MPSLAAAPPDHLQGHVRIEELLDGALVRFVVADAGYLRFGDGGRVFEEAPPRLAYAERAITRAFDLGSYLDTVDDLTRYTFVGVATHRRHIDYDWDRLPPVLGTAIHDAAGGRWFPPDRVERVFERLGPPPLDPVERERSIGRRPLDGYDLPASVWYDGPAAGVVITDKRGDRAKLVRADLPRGEPSARVETGDAEGLAERFVTDALLADRAAALGGKEDVAFDPLFEAVLNRVTRAHHDALFHGATDTGGVDLDWGRFRGAVAERVRRWLGGE
jgi:hypothetical protein